MNSKFLILFQLLFIYVVSANAQNIVLDSSFEGHNTNGCDYNNSDINFDGHYSDVNAFAYNGTGEIDIMKSTSCIGENPPIGATHLGLAYNGDLDRYDQISLNLSTPIVSGTTFDLSFWVDMVEYTVQEEGDIEFGISDSSTAFGTLVHAESVPLTGGYVQYMTTFTAPVNGFYLTIRPKATGTSNRCWMHIDGVELIGEPLPLCEISTIDTDTMIMPVDTLSDFTLIAETDIVLTGLILAGSGIDTLADLRAGNSITLNGPFEIELGTNSLLYISQCDPSNLPFKSEGEDLLRMRSTETKEENPVMDDRDYRTMVPAFH